MEEHIPDKYAVYKAAQESGGPCPICDWRDGDGVRTCFYDSELGVVSHQNSEAGAEATMTPQQRSLFRLRSKLLYANPAARECWLDQWEAELKRKYAEHQAANLPYPFLSRGNNVEMPIEERIAEYRAEQEKEPTAADEPYNSWVQTPAGRLNGGHMVHCEEPHPDCGGVQHARGPYHLRCTKCGVEVKLWEHGIDYDVG